MPHVPRFRGLVLDLPAVTLTFLANITDTAMGILATFRMVHPHTAFDSTAQFGLMYFVLSLSLTTLLTVMIILRLVLHARNIRNALGSRANASGLYKTIVVTLVESYALYTITFIVLIVLGNLVDPLGLFFAPVFAGTQVSATLESLQSTAILQRCRLINGKTGHRSPSRRSTSRQSTGLDERKYCLREPRFNSFQESRAVDG